MSYQNNQNNQNNQSDQEMFWLFIALATGVVFGLLL